MLKNHICKENCQKKTRWFQTCDHIQGKLKEINAKEKLDKNLDQTTSDTIDDLIIAKHAELFSNKAK